MCLFMPCLFQYSHSFTYFSCLDLAIFGNVIDFHGKVYFFLCGFSRFPDSILFLHKSGKKQEKKIVATSKNSKNKTSQNKNASVRNRAWSFETGVLSIQHILLFHDRLRWKSPLPCTILCRTVPAIFIGAIITRFFDSHICQEAVLFSQTPIYFKL